MTKREYLNFIENYVFKVRRMEGFRNYSDGKLDSRSINAILIGLEQIEYALKQLKRQYKTELTKTLKEEELIMMQEREKLNNPNE